MATRVQRAATGALLATAALVPSALGVVMSAQISRVRRNESLPRPDYRVDLTVDPPWADRTQPPLRIAFIGDSLVEGVGAPEPGQSLPAQTAYRLTAHLHRSVHMRSYGVACSRVEHVLAEQVPQLDADTDLVLAMIGANDATHATPPWEFSRRLEAMVTRAHDRTGAPVILFGLPDLEAAPLLARPLKDVAGLFGDTLHRVQRRIAERHPDARYVELRRELATTFRRHPKELFASDGYHPNPAGYALIAEVAARSLADLLREEQACAADESSPIQLLEARRAAPGSNRRLPAAETRAQRHRAVA